jgi:hypothetical protein
MVMTIKKLNKKKIASKRERRQYNKRVDKSSKDALKSAVSATFKATSKLASDNSQAINSKTTSNSVSIKTQPLSPSTNSNLNNSINEAINDNKQTWVTTKTSSQLSQEIQENNMNLSNLIELNEMEQCASNPNGINNGSSKEHFINSDDLIESFLKSLRESEFELNNSIQDDLEQNGLKGQLIDYKNSCSYSNEPVKQDKQTCFQHQSIKHLESLIVSLLDSEYRALVRWGKSVWEKNLSGFASDDLDDLSSFLELNCLDMIFLGYIWKSSQYIGSKNAPENSIESCFSLPKMKIKKEKPSQSSISSPLLSPSSLSSTSSSAAHSSSSSPILTSPSYMFISSQMEGNAEDDTKIALNEFLILDRKHFVSINLAELHIRLSKLVNKFKSIRLTFDEYLCMKTLSLIKSAYGVKCSDELEKLKQKCFDLFEYLVAKENKSSSKAKSNERIFLILLYLTEVKSITVAFSYYLLNLKEVKIPDLIMEILNRHN